MIIYKHISVKVSFTLSSGTRYTETYQDLLTGETTVTNTSYNGVSDNGDYVPLIFSGEAYGQTYKDIQVLGPYSPDFVDGGPENNSSNLGKLQFGHNKLYETNIGNSEGISTKRFLTHYYLEGRIDEYYEGEPPTARFGETINNKTFDKVITDALNVYGNPYHDEFTINYDNNYYSYVWNTISVPVGIGELFTGFKDTVNFNTLQSIQRDAIITGANLYDAGAGNDEVFIPKKANYELATGVRWNNLYTFFGGSGDDKITGGDGNDKIDGGIGNDTFIGSLGSDNIKGGAGKDTFDYQVSGFTGLTSGTTQTLDGGAEDANTKDLIKLPGSANDYSFQVNFGATWADTKTVITTLDSSGFPKVVLTTSEIERAVFQARVDNVVNLTGNSLTVEMAVLAKEVYGPLEAMSHKAETLQSDLFGIPHSADPTTSAAVSSGRNWHAVSALELGILPGDFRSPEKPGAYGTLEWSFVNGHYAAYTDGLLPDNPEANAIVLSGDVKGYGKSIAIVLRGTDQHADFSTYPSFKNYYDLYKPLVDGLKTYLNENQVDSILVAGHSLGAGALQHLLNEDFLKNNTKVHAWSFGSPGSEVAGSASLYNFVHTDDLVTKAQDASTGAQLVGLGGLLSGNPLALAIGAIGILAGKERTGSDVRINSDVSGLPWFDEHAQTLYIQDVIKLNEFANDAASPFQNSDLADAIRSGSTYKGPDIQVGVGKPINLSPTPQQYAGAYMPTIHASKSDSYVLANNKAIDDDIVVSSRNLVADVTRIFDGGTGTNDRLILSYGKSFFSKQQVGSAIDLTFKPVNGTPEAVGSLHRIEGIVYRNAIEWLDGRTALVQKFGEQASSSSARMASSSSLLAATAVSTFQLQAGFDAADAGDGKLSVLGTAGNDTLFVGTGDKIITLGEGRDILMARDTTLTTSALTVSAGGDDDIVYASQGADTIDGGTGSDTLYGGGGNDVIDGGAGADILAGETGDDWYVVDDLGDTVLEASGDGYDTVVASVSYALAAGQEIEKLQAGANSGSSNLNLSGNEFSNTLVGNAGANVLNGGAGSDILVGGAGADVLDGGAGYDQVLYINSTQGIIADLFTPATANSGEAAGDTYVSIEGLGGSQFADLLIGGITSTLNGFGGDDNLVGGSLGDYLFGDDGNDNLYGGGSGDYLSGGAGFDAARYDNAGSGVTAVLINSVFNAGTDAAGDIYTGIEAVVGSNFNDVLIGDNGNNLIAGQGGNDFLDGYAGNDTLYGGAGADIFSFKAGTGNDVVGDFTAQGWEHDTILIGTNVNGSGIVNYASLQSHLTQNGADVLIDLGAGNSVLLQNVQLTQLTSSDFAFG